MSINQIFSVGKQYLLRMFNNTCVRSQKQVCSSLLKSGARFKFNVPVKWLEIITHDKSNVPLLASCSSLQMLFYLLYNVHFMPVVFVISFHFKWSVLVKTVLQHNIMCMHLYDSCLNRQQLRILPVWFLEGDDVTEDVLQLTKAFFLIILTSETTEHHLSFLYW